MRSGTAGTCTHVTHSIVLNILLLSSARASCAMIASLGAMSCGPADRYFQKEVTGDKLVPRSVEGQAPYNGLSFTSWLAARDQILAALVQRSRLRRLAVGAFSDDWSPVCRWY
ncbi:MAG: hypothetical protein ABJ246_03970 [Paracoccaceae bacterium]